MPTRLIPELAALFGGDELDDDFKPKGSKKTGEFIPPKPEARPVDPYTPRTAVPNPDQEFWREGLDDLKRSPAARVAKRTLDVLSAPGSAAARGAAAWADKVDTQSGLETARDVAAEAAKGFGAALAGDSTSFSEELGKRGVDLGLGKGFLADIATDPSNLVPTKAVTAAALPLLASVRGLSKVDDVARVVPDVAKAIDVEALLREADQLDELEEAARQGGYAYTQTVRNLANEALREGNGAKLSDLASRIDPNLGGTGILSDDLDRIKVRLSESADRAERVGIGSPADLAPPSEREQRIAASLAMEDGATGPGAVRVSREVVNNASGDSAASVEAINRLNSMSRQGQRFAVRSGGGVRPLPGVDAVDYTPRPGEQFGILHDDGSFAVLQDGGRRRLLSERGFAAAGMLPELGGAAAGAATGAAVDDDNRLRGAVVGAVAGAAGGAGLKALVTPNAAQNALVAAQQATETAQPYVERLIKRVPERPEALGQPLTGVVGTDGLAQGTARRAEEEARMYRFVTESVGITKPEDQAVVQQILDDGDRFYEHRRITRPWSQAEDESWKLAWRGVKLPKGATLNDSQMFSLERKVRGITEYASEVAQDIEQYKVLAAAGDPQAAGILNKYGVSSQNALEIVGNQAMEEAMVGWRSVTGVRSELGRGLNALKKKIAARSVAQNDEEFIQRAAAFGTEGSEIRQAMTKFTTPEQRYQFLRNLARPDGQALFKWYYISSLLSGPKTHARNIASNTINALAMNVGNVAGGAFDVARGRVALNDFRNETAQALRGQIDGIGKGWRAAMDVWRQGFTAEDAMTFAEKPPEIRMSDVFGTTAFDTERSTRWLNSVSRFLEASDQFSRTIMFSGALHQGAYREASRMLKAGTIKPSQFQKTIDEIVADPALLAPKVFQEAVDISKDAVYRQDAGRFLRGIMEMQKGLDEIGRKYVGGAVDKLPTRALRTAGHIATAPLQNAGTVVAPFIKTPAGVFKKQFRAMGGGFLTANRLAQDGKELQAAIHRGEAMLGVAAMSLPMLYMLQKGPDARPFITGSGPNDPNLKDQDQKALDAFYASARPSSLRLPGSDTWIDYRSMGPLAGPLSVVGNLSDAYHQNRGLNYQAMTEMFARQGRSMLSNSFLTGVMGLVSAFEDRTGVSANRVIGRTIAGFVPASGALRGARSFDDNVIRDTRDDTLGGTVQQNVSNIVPGMSRAVPARVDYAGKVLRQPGSAVARVVNPFDVATIPEDATRNEMAKLGPEAYLAKPPKDLKDEMGNPMDLTNLQSTELQRMVGIAQYQAAQRLLARPGFLDLPPDQRAQLLRREMATYRDVAKSQYRQHVRSVTTARP